MVTVAAGGEACEVSSAVLADIRGFAQSCTEHDCIKQANANRREWVTLMAGISLPSSADVPTRFSRLIDAQ